MNPKKLFAMFGLAAVWARGWAAPVTQCPIQAHPVKRILFGKRVCPDELATERPPVDPRDLENTPYGEIVPAYEGGKNVIKGGIVKKRTKTCCIL